MGDKFLGSGGANINISNGTASIFGASIGAINLDPSQPLKTNSVRQLVSSKLDIDDINNLQNELNNAITDPITLKEKVQPANPAVNTKIIYASSADNEIHLLDEFGVDKIFSTSTTPFLPLGGGTMTGNLDMGNNQILNTSIAGGLGLEVQNNKDNIIILQSDLGTETTNRTNADTNLQNQINSNDTDISNLQTDLGTETTNRTNADTNLQNQINSNDTDITNLQNGKVNKGGEPTGNLSIGTQALNTSGIDISENGAPILQCGATTTGGDIEIRRTLKFTPFPTGTTQFYAFASDVAAGDSALQTQITNNLNQISANIGDISTLQTDLGTETTNRTNADTNLQNQITSNDTDIFTLTPQKLDITQTFTDTTKWDAANKSANVSITNGTINKPSDTSIAHAQSTIYDVSQDIDLEITINSLSGPSLYLGLTDIGNLGTANFANLNNNSNELFIIVFTTGGPSVYYRWKSNSQSIPLTTYFYKNVQIISPGDVIILKIRNTILSAFFNGEPLADFTPNTNYFNEEKFKLASNLYLRIGDDSTLLSDFNITLKESLPPLQSIDNRDTLYEVKYNPESNINLPAPQRIGQKLTLYNNQNKEQYQTLQGSDIGNGNVFKMISDNIGNIYLAGSFTSVNGATINRIARYNSDTGQYSACDGGIDDGQVNDMVQISESLILIVGTFTTYNSGTVIGRGKGLLRYDPIADTLSEAADGPTGNVNVIIKDPILKYAYIGGTFSTIDEGKNSLTVNRVAIYNYANDVFLALPNDISVGITSGSSVQGLEITPNGRYIYLTGSILSAGNYTNLGNICRYDTQTNIWSSLGTLNQQGNHLKLYDNYLYLASEALTQITQLDSTIKSINEFARYNTKNRQWNAVAENDLDGEVNVIEILPNGEVIVGGLMTNHFYHMSKFGKKLIGSGMVFAAQVYSLIYDDYSGYLYVGGNFTQSNNALALNRIMKIPISPLIKYNQDVEERLILGDKIEVQARDLNYWF